MNNIKESIVERRITIPKDLCEIEEIQEIGVECNTYNSNKKKYNDHVRIILNGQLNCLMEYTTNNDLKEIKYYNFKVYFNEAIDIYQKELFNKKVNINSIIEKVTFKKLESRMFEIMVLICNIA